MKKGLPLLWMFYLIILSTFACNLPILSRVVQDTDLEERIERTVEAGLEVSATKPQIQTSDQQEASTTHTPTITVTPTITSSATPSVPMARVSQNTNCRTGPGTEYDIVYIFMVGDEAEIIARSSVPNYVIIKVPDGSGRKCWLWMQYGEQTGDTSGLPQETPPPTPTPKATPTPEIDFTLTFDSTGTCMTVENVYVRINNTGPVEIKSRQVTAVDQDTAHTAANTSDGFSSSPDCISLGIDAISPGGYAYVAAGFPPFIAGHTIQFTTKACSGDGLTGVCATKTITIDLPNISDVNVKKDFEPIDKQEILELVSALPIMTWSYIDSEREGRHIGPMAQDFNELFGVGESQELISSVDSYGVALAAIQALADSNEDQAARIILLEDQNQALQAQLEAIKTQGRQQLILLWVILIGFLLVTLSAVIMKRSRSISRD